MASKFTLEEAISFGWKITKKNIAFFIGLLVIVFIINFIPGLISEYLNENLVGLIILINLAAWVLQVIIGMGLIKIGLNFVDGKKSEIGDLFSCVNLFIKYFLGSLLYGLIVLGGLILLIVPGVIWAIKYQFFSYYIVDKGMGPLDAIKNSGKITDGAKGTLFIFGLVLGLINLLGALALLVGLFVTIPIAMVAMAYVFRKLEAQTAGFTASATPVAESAPEAQAVPENVTPPVAENSEENK